MRKLVIAALGICLLSACWRGERRELQQVGTYLDERPDSALAVLSGMDRSLLKTRKDRADFALLYATALDKNYIDTTDAEVIMPAVEYYRHHGSVYDRAKSLYYYARIRQNAGDYTGAIVTFSEIFPLLDGIDDLCFHGRLYSALACIYNVNNDYPEALRWQIKSFKAFEESGSKSQKRIAAYELAGRYADVSQYDKADSLYSTVIDDPDTPAFLCGKARCRLAFSLACRQRDDGRALDLYRSVLSTDGALGCIDDYAAYAYMLSLNGDEEGARALFSQIEGIDPMKARYWRSKTYARTGEYDKAYHDFKSSVEMRDSTVIAALSQSVSKAQKDYYRAESEKSQMQERNMRRMLILCVLVFFLIIFGLVLLDRTNRQRMENELHRLVMLEEEARSQLTEANTDLDIERRRLRDEFVMQNQKIFAEIGNLCEMILSVPKNTSSLKYRKLYDSVKEKLKCIDADPERQRQFEQSLNERVNNVMAEFRADFPNLSENDYINVSYYFAGFGTNAIMLLANYPSSNAIYARRSRIRKMVESSDVPNRNLYLKLLQAVK